MKKNNLIVLITCIILMSTTIKPVYANFEAEPEPVIAITPRFTTISTTTTALNNSNGRAVCGAALTAKSSTCKLQIFMYLESLQSGTWTPYASWSTSTIGSGCLLSKMITVASGRTYRLKVSYYANGENVIQYSKNVAF